MADPSPGPSGTPAHDPRIGEVVVTAEQIRERITELGAQITADYADRAPLLVGILKGADWPPASPMPCFSVGRAGRPRGL